MHSIVMPYVKYHSGLYEYKLEHLFTQPLAAVFALCPYCEVKVNFEGW